MTRYYLIDNGVPVELKGTPQVRYMGVMVTSDLKPSEQCRAAKTARTVLGMMHRHLKNFSPRHFLIIYKTHVRPHLEYYIQSY